MRGGGLKNICSQLERFTTVQLFAWILYNTRKCIVSYHGNSLIRL